MWFGYHPGIIEHFPEVAAGVIWVESFLGEAGSSEIDALLAGSETLVRERCPERAVIAQQPSIAAWRDAYSRMGLKPNRYPCATEQLMRRIVDGNAVPRISPLVDLGNTTALRYMITVAPFDTANIKSFCEVRYARGDQRFWPINGDTPDEIPEREVIFADESRDVISRRWAWRQSDKAKITPETRQCVIVLEAMHADAHDTVTDATDFLASQLRDQLYASLRWDVIEKTIHCSYRVPN